MLANLLPPPSSSSPSSSRPPHGTSSASVAAAAAAMALAMAVSVTLMTPSNACYVYYDEEKDPCAQRTCEFGADCVPSHGGLSARCVCPERCYSFGDSVGSKPVCGSDGRTYANVCELKKHACNAMRDVRVVQHGECDPCAGFECPGTQVCQLDERRLPACRCAANCSLEFHPVCGSDGRTYSNDCILRQEACKRRRRIRVIAFGECNTQNNPCSRKQCAEGRQCVVDRTGTAKCVCEPACEPVVQPVCADDGATYDSECELRRAVCVGRATAKLSYYGPCVTNGPCARFVCRYGVCQEVDGRAHCVCPECGQQFDQVCGSDGQTYTNECHLRSESCLRRQPISVQRKGPCNNCQQSECEFYGICQQHGTGSSCVCPQSCAQHVDKVCGTDGVTYSNECQLRVTSCKRQTLISVHSKGDCDLCRGVRCRFGAHCESGRCVCPRSCPRQDDPVCGSDGVTYAGECEMRRHACKTTSGINVEYAGVCDDFGGSGADDEPGDDAARCDASTCGFGGVCKRKRRKLVCECNFDCPAERFEICGSDDRTYESECEMRQMSCEQQTSIEVKAKSRCDEVSEEMLCDGFPPLKSALSGRELSCGDGGDLCPQSSYCHHLDGRSRCCDIANGGGGGGASDATDCKLSRFGCCLDQRTSAPSANGSGCPSQCKCNTLGSLSATCDPVTQQCRCKIGVGGRQCNRCQHGYWGLPLIAEGKAGCQPCNCHLWGSLREDCEQIAGRCVCKFGVSGQRCDYCGGGRELGPTGCVDRGDSSRRPQDSSRRHKTTRDLLPGRVTSQVQHPTEASGERRADGVGDPCTHERDCQLGDSVCDHGTCRCRSGLELRGSSCVKFHPLSTEGPATVANDGKLSFLGELPQGDQPAAYLNSAKSSDTVQVPSFAGLSYLQIGRLHHAARELHIRMSFKVLNPDAILLYTGDSKSGDFLSLAVKKSKLQFRFNLGSGSLVLESLQKVTLGEFHTASARRFGQDGMLQLDGGREVSGSSPGVLKALNLDSQISLGYLAHPKEEILQNMQVRTGLVGCIRSLKLSSQDHSQQFDLRYPSSPHIVSGRLIEECSDNECSHFPCQNGAMCFPQKEGAQFQCDCQPGWTGSACDLDEIDQSCQSSPCGAMGKCYGLSVGKHKCICNPGRRGVQCEHKMDYDISVAATTGHSYMQIKLTQPVSKALSFEVWFLAQEPNGCILYGTQAGSNKDDFIAVALVDGYIEFRFDLGSGEALMRSQKPITLNTWHRLNIARTNRHGTIIVDGGVDGAVRGHSKGSLRELNLADFVYLGGYPGVVHARSSCQTGLVGAIQRLYENTRLVKSLVEGPTADVTQYEGDPCPLNANPCHNNALCIPQLNHFECKCTPEYTGRICDKTRSSQDITRPVAFDGKTFHRYANQVTSSQLSQKENKIIIRLRTTATEGLILLMHKTSTIAGDFLALAITDGTLEMSFNLGKQSITNALHSLNSEVRIDDGKWHDVLLIREKRKGTLVIDGSSSVSDVSVQGATLLNTDGNIWFGGTLALPSGLPLSYGRGFVGCIANVSIDGRTLDLVKHRLSFMGVDFCDI